MAKSSDVCRVSLNALEWGGREGEIHMYLALSVFRFCLNLKATTELVCVIFSFLYTFFPPLFLFERYAK